MICRNPGPGPRVLAAALLTLVAGCGAGGRGVDATIDAFLGAVQSADADSLYCLLAGAAEADELGATDAERREAFGRWLQDEYRGYLEGRDAGQVALDGHGIRLVKLFALGRGTFMSRDLTRRPDPDTRIVEAQVRFGYAHIDLSRFSAGTTFYVAGVPVGRVHALRVPETSAELTADVLDRVRVDWTLVRGTASGGCPAGWRIAGVEPLSDSAASTEITWVF